MEKMQQFVVKRATGECLIELCPLFSSNGKILFVTTENIVRAYSTQTGVHIRDYEGLTTTAVGVRLHPSNPQLLLACSRSGELLEWKWETDASPKKVRLKIPLHVGNVTGFHVVAQQKHYDIIITFTRDKKRKVKCMMLNSKTGEDTYNTWPFSFDNHPHSLAVGGNDGSKFAAGICRHLLHMVNLKNGKNLSERIGGDRVLTCVACHPQEYTVATGDNTGRVLLWQGCFQTASKPVCSVYHWHTLPVNDVVFSQEGSLFYSGGSERVLVKWVVAHPKNNQFVPRMADAIHHLAVAPDNTAVAVCLADNGIHIYDARLMLVCLIQHSSVSGQLDLMKPYFSFINQGLNIVPKLFPAGIHVDPRSRTVVMNGRVGHVQFVDRQTSRLVCNLEVTGVTYLTQERNTVIVNIDVVKLAFSSDGLWLATVEHLEEPGKPVTFVKLKFWLFNVVKQIFFLNTCVSNPHFGAVQVLQFQPIAPDEPLMAATSGEDNKFKLWIQTESNSIHKEGMVWRCDSVGVFRNLPAGPLCFSADGSILAVAFSSTLTLWTPETCQLKTNLTHSKLSSAIRHVVFGQLSCCHLVCVATDSHLAVWNLLTLCLDWVVSVKLCALVADPASMLMAAFSDTNKLFMFVPSSSDLLLNQQDLLPDSVNVVCAVFAPREKAQNTYKNESQLVFLTTTQELMVLDRKQDVQEYDGNLSVQHRLPYESDIPTPFTMFLGKQRKTDVEAPEKKLERHMGDPARQAVRQLLTTPAHTMISIARLCQPVLLSFLTTKSQVNQKISDDPPINEDEADDSDESDEPNARVHTRQMPSQMLTTKVRVVPEAEMRSMEDRLEPLLAEHFDWVAQLQPS